MYKSRTISFYLARQFTAAILGMFLISLIMIYIIDLVELLRRAGSSSKGQFSDIATLALYKLPGMAEQTLPFAILFGSMFAFMKLSRQQELVVMRSAGMSVWQFIKPPFVVTLMIGTLAITAYNPIAARLTSIYERQEGQFVFRDKDKGLMNLSKNGVWLRQNGADGPSILFARKSSDRGLRLYQVLALLYDANDVFTKRLEAATAKLKAGAWQLGDVKIYAHGKKTVHTKSYRIRTSLSPTQIMDSFASPNSISFWELPKFIKLADKAGLTATRYRLHYQVLLAKPLLMCAMVLVAATFSMRLFRMGNITRMIVGGLATGFLLFFTNDIARAIGGAGLVPSYVAAWTPAVIAILFGIAVLFFQEDS